MMYGENNTQALEDFYNALNEIQKAKVEVKLSTMLREQIGILPLERVNALRYQVAADMFRILKG